ncbi:hypothetical protein D3H35_29260 [Cohnella faecalis]|uniref:Uncharacterized protein n=1 Tax=Cohnella faecalis TaxID=2315694 RepID=A0A398CGV4_9BACL|nr:hypothetical protein D3H35_29260 [Cohnella faecalis]
MRQLRLRYTKIIGYYDTIPNDFLATYASPFRDYKEITYVGGANGLPPKVMSRIRAFPTDGHNERALHTTLTLTLLQAIPLLFASTALQKAQFCGTSTSRIPSGWAITEISDHIFPEKDRCGSCELIKELQVSGMSSPFAPTGAEGFSLFSFRPYRNLILNQ